MATQRPSWTKAARALGAVGLAALLAAGCQGGNLWTTCTTDDECGPGARCLEGECRPSAPGDSGPDAGDGDPDTGPIACVGHADCDGGWCVGGACCATAEQICGESCCQPGATCFAQACVVPGALCHSTYDCEEGQYCEHAFGAEADGDADVDADADADADAESDLDAGLDAGDGGCLYPAPGEGRCLDLPPPCPGGVDPGDGTVCIPDCEVHQPAGRPIDARVRWRWGPEAVEFPNHIDVWSTPVVGRVTDTNCDGRVDQLDPPNVIVVSGNATNADGTGTCCQCTDRANSACRTGVLRVLDGLTGREVWSLRQVDEASIGFSGVSVAIGHLVPEGALDGGATTLDIAVVTGEGHLAIIGASGEVLRRSDVALPSDENFGWGGGLAIADMDADGFPEIAYGASVFTTAGGGLTQVFRGTAGAGGIGSHTWLSSFADLDGAADGRLELLAGNTAYDSTGAVVWQRTDLPDGFTGVADFDRDGAPEVVLVASGLVYVLAGATGATLAGPATLPSSGHGGPPTIADFEGDGLPEIGVAQQSFYTMLEPQLEITETATQWLGLALVWQAPNHDLSSSVTGSTVFDFEGDGAAEVIYNDECFLWVYDGATGAVRFATPTNSFTGTEASLVADVDGDGHAEMLMISSGADPSSAGWGCDVAPWNQPDPAGVRPAWAPPEGGRAWRGLTLWGDAANAWVGTRTLWNQHTYHVSNICDHRDDACTGENVYGGIPRQERPNWAVPWLDNFRQNVQDEGIYDAPDATVTLEAECATPVSLRAFVRNLGAAVLPAGAEVGFFLVRDGAETPLGSAVTERALYPGQVSELTLAPAPELGATAADTFVARLLVDPLAPLFRECRDDNNESAPATALCLN